MKEYDINEVIRLRDLEKLQWKLIEETIGVSSETLRKTYKGANKGHGRSERLKYYRSEVAQRSTALDL